MVILQKFKKYPCQVINLNLLAILFFLVSCEQKLKSKEEVKNCIYLPQIIKLQGKKDTLKEGEKYYGKVIFSEKLDKKVSARVFVLGQEIYFNRDTTQFEFFPELTSKTSETKEIYAKIELKYHNCLDTVINLSTKYFLKK